MGNYYRMEIDLEKELEDGEKMREIEEIREFLFLDLKEVEELAKELIGKYYCKVKVLEKKYTKKKGEAVELVNIKHYSSLEYEVKK
jgi:hypothetical protein